MKDLEIKMQKNTEFVSILRAFAVICILLYHLIQECGNPYLKMTSQFFNIGVNLFIIISGFCFGLQGHIENTTNWFLKRIKRIFVPYELFLIILSIIYIVKDLKFHRENWISCILGIQGARVGVLGADHTWFLTALLICYMLTPFISSFCDKYNNKKIMKWCIVGEVFCIPAILACVPDISVYTIGSNVCF